MKDIKKSVLATLLLAVVFSLVSLIRTDDVFAASKTWTGGGADDNFSTSGNWSPSGAPVDGDTLTFPINTIFEADCAADITLDNDLVTNDVTIAGITISGDLPTNCYKDLKITGNTIDLGGDIASSTGAAYSVFDAPITLSANATLQGISGQELLTIGSFDLVLDRASFSSGLSGSGDISLTNSPSSDGGAGGGCTGLSSAYPVSGDSSDFSGALTINDDSGLTISTSSSDLARYASSITLNTGGWIVLYAGHGENLTIDTPITVNGGTIYASQASQADTCNAPTAVKTATLTGAITLTGAAEIDLNYLNLVFSGTLTGKSYISVVDGGIGSITYPDGSTAESSLKVRTITDENDCWLSSSQINNKDIVNIDCSGTIGLNEDTPQEVRGIVAGSGRIGHVKILDGGIIAPGTSPGTLSTSNLEFEEGGIYEFEIEGNDAGEYDQINVAGTVKLGSGTLRVIQLDSFKPSSGKSFVIIKNNGNDKVTGTFAGLTEGATVESTNGKVSYTISYKGGDGNDVELTSIPGVGDAGELQKKPINNAIYVGAAVMTTATLGSYLKKSRRFSRRRS